MKCDVCGRELNKFEAYYDISIGKYIHADRDDWIKKWKQLPPKIKEAYGSFERYLDDKTLSIIDIRYVWICENCIKDPAKVGNAILKRLKEEIGEDLEL